jgi:alpha-tubulin suppressor-like RCC1 family protein
VRREIGGGAGLGWRHVLLRAHGGGEVFCWGGNAGGQLGDGLGDGADHPDPVAIELPGPALDVAAGYDSFACAIVDGSSRRVWCWGAQLLGNLGTGAGTGIFAPTEAPLLLNGVEQVPRDVELGDLFGCASTNQGPYCWGKNEQCQAAASNAFPTVDTPRYVPFGGLNRDDRLFVGLDFAGVSPASEPFGPYPWGANSDGQTGVASPSTVCEVGYSSFEVDGVSAHFGRHACGRGTSANEVSCWGSNSAGQLGLDPSGPDVLPPISVSIPEAVVELSLGFETSCARGASGAWYCWGRPIGGLVPTGHLPVEQPALTGFTSLSLGSDHGCGVDTNGTVQCFGASTGGKTGPNASSPAPASVPLD